MSPFADILYTNNVPGNSQISAIRSFLDPLQSELADKDAEVQRLQSALEAATQARDQLRDLISAHEALLSPMRRIPNDVLGLIFQHTLPERRHTALDPSEGPLLLMRVCRYWRDLALGTPRLWAAMHVVWAPATIDRLVQQMKLWFARSCAVPLDINMYSSRQIPLRQLHPSPPLAGEDRDSDADADAELPNDSPLSVLLSEARRWRTIRVSVTLPDESTALNRLSTADVPLLSSFDISMTSAAEEGEHGFEFLATPSLRRLAFSGAYTVIPPAIQWQNIVVLQLRSYHDSESGASLGCTFPFPFLQHCTALEKLSLTISSDVVMTTHDRVQLPKLTRLSFASFGDPNGSSDCSAILHTLDLPSLSTFDLQFNQATIGIFQTPCFANIQCLVLPAMLLPTEDVHAILALLPLLERLRLIGEPIIRREQGLAFPDEEFLRGLVLKDDSDADSDSDTGKQPPLCPSLRHIEFTSSRAVSDALILSFILSRTLPAVAHFAGVAELTDFNCYCYREQQLDIRAAPELADALSRGFRLLLGYEPPVGMQRYTPLEGTERERATYGVLANHVGDPRETREAHEWLQDFSADGFLAS
uniref:F-box domain-containing protein n=1 Tax=Mycena chlorophos TaxID=658473 RepID=A0ABQ0MCW7_MYCCL|nr:predicted protein [Mycena chlorophos]